MVALGKKPKPMTAAERISADTRARQERDTKTSIIEPIRLTRLLRADVSAVSVEECEEALRLHQKARDAQDDGAVRDDLSALSKSERARFLELLDRMTPAKDREARRAVRAERERRYLQAVMDEEINRGVPPEKRAGLMRGEVLLPPSAVEISVLNVEDLGTLAVIAWAWSSGRIPFTDARWSDDGEAILVSSRRLRFADKTLTIADLEATVTFLDRNGFLTASRDERAGWVIALGPRMREHQG